MHTKNILLILLSSVFLYSHGMFRPAKAISTTVAQATTQPMHLHYTAIARNQAHTHKTAINQYPTHYSFPQTVHAPRIKHFSLKPVLESQAKSTIACTKLDIKTLDTTHKGELEKLIITYAHDLSDESKNFLFDNPDGFKEALLQISGDEDYSVFLAKQHNNIIGCAITDPKQRLLKLFFVVDKVQGKEVASKLMAYTLKQFIVKGCDLVQLYVFSDNLRAIKFYQKWGFNLFTFQDESVSTYLSNNKHVCMRKVLKHQSRIP